MSGDEAIRITLDDGSTVSALWTTRQDSSDADRILIYAPGAGSDLRDPFGVFVAGVLPSKGIDVLRFQFRYAEAGKHLPDRTPVLEATWRSALEAIPSAPGRRVIAAGRSMGGRIASQVVAGGAAVDALALFAYPLHPPGKPEQRRDGHLAAISVPALFCSGSRDPFATPDELSAATARMPRATLHLLEGADHGFSIARRSGRTREDVWMECIDSLLTWLSGIDGQISQTQ